MNQQTIDNFTQALNVFLTEAFKLEAPKQEEPKQEQETPKRKRRTKAEIEAAKEAEAPTVDSDLMDLLDGTPPKEESTPMVTKKDVYDLAKELLINGELAKVKAALDAVGAAKVDLIPDDKLALAYKHLQ